MAQARTSDQNKQSQSMRPASTVKHECVAEQPTDRQLKLITLARSWIGTPYHHQQSLKGAGCDCLGMIRGIYEEHYRQPTAPITPYSRDWADVTGRETLLEAARQHLEEKKVEERAPGDVLIFRFRRWMVAKHAGLMTGPETMVHAMEGAAVREISLSPWWQRKIAAVFSFPPNPRNKY